MTRPRRPAQAGVGPVNLTVEDLRKRAPNIDEDAAESLIADAIALAAVAAPCITRKDFKHTAAAAAIIKAAILRWNDQGTGGMSSLTADVFSASLDTRTPRTAAGFLDSELDQLAELCRRKPRGAFSINTAPQAGAALSEWLEQPEAWV